MPDALGEATGQHSTDSISGVCVWCPCPANVLARIFETLILPSFLGRLDILELMAGGYGVQNAVPQKGSEMNLTLGGIDLNNSGSVLVRAEKKLLTVLFPDGCAFTLKAETEEDVDEWKEALERALEAAPNASPGGGS